MVTPEKTNVVHVQAPVPAPVVPESFHEFRDWLASKPADATVGYAGRAKQCPVANYVAATRKIRIAINSEGYYSNGLYGLSPAFPGHRRTPAWASKFILCLDRQVTFAVTAKTALEVLETTCGHRNSWCYDIGTKE